MSTHTEASYVCAQVIMGSMVLAGRGTNGSTNSSAVMGSIAVCLMKLLSCPLLVVKDNAKNANIQWDSECRRIDVCTKQVLCLLLAVIPGSCVSYAVMGSDV